MLAREFFLHFFPPGNHHSRKNQESNRIFCGPGGICCKQKYRFGAFFGHGASRVAQQVSQIGHQDSLTKEKADNMPQRRGMRQSPFSLPYCNRDNEITDLFVLQ
jgi:hypothetical protein